MKKNKWYTLDNAAKIFPPTSNNEDPKVFRFACELNENVEYPALQDALDLTIKEFPIFTSTLKKGFFWYYLETTNIKPIVNKEYSLPCAPISRHSKLLFNVTYFKRRINLEVYHALTDGTGALKFLKTLVFHYLTIKHGIDTTNVTLDESSLLEKESDSFEKYYNPKIKRVLDKEAKAFTLKGNRYVENRLKIIEGIVKSSSVITKAHEFKTTVTVYLTALLILSISEVMNTRDKKRPIVITIPVNLRNYFKSDTARNFFSVITVSHKVKESETLVDVIRDVEQQFNDNLSKEAIEIKMNNLAFLEHNFMIRLVPVFIKDIVLSLFYRMSRSKQTIAISNIGVIKMPSVVEKYINLFDVFTSTDCMQMCMCSFNDKMVLSFTSHFTNCEIQKNFFRKLSDIGIIINTNVIDEEDE